MNNGQPRPVLQYIQSLERLKAGDLALLRTHAGKGVDESVHAFDLFTGLWWPLRQKTQRAPRREVAWLIAKLYAFRPIPHAPGMLLAAQMSRLQPADERAQERFRNTFDQMLLLPLRHMEPALQWAVDWVWSRDPSLDWVKLTDDLSIWERESTRLAWARQFLNI